MKRFLLLSLALISFSCQQTGVIIATEENGLITVDTKDLKDTITVPLSELIEDLEIIQLESNVEYSTNLERTGMSFMSDNYIIMLGYNKKILLFNRKTGKYICDIGDRGNGHGEYNNVSYAHINEAEGVVYLLADWTKIKIYGLDGKFMENIPLAKDVDEHTTIAISINDRDKVITAFSGAMRKSMLWKQDFEGNEIADIYSNETERKSYNVRMNNNGESINVNISNLNNQPDTLYRLDSETNTIKPVFILNVSNLNETEDYNGVMYQKNYFETPTCFITEITEFKMIKEGNAMRISSKLLDGGVLVNKENLTGGNFKIYNDFIGLDIRKKVNYKEGMLVIGYDDAQMLIEQLENISDEQKANMNSKTRNRIDELLSTLDEDGNTVVMIGKLK
ncbi:MAG: 6-bladed beta-propeller [Rikenellaceae bacterium]